jgi:alpha 1,6-mannosyltransferase
LIIIIAILTQSLTHCRRPSTTMIHDPEQPGASLSGRALAFATRRRPRHLIAAIVGVCLITAFMLWNSPQLDGLVVDKLAGPHDSVIHDSVANHQHPEPDFQPQPPVEDLEKAPAPEQPAPEQPAPEPSSSPSPSPSAETKPSTLAIPAKIWQILLPQKPDQAEKPVNPEQLQDTPSWLAMNRDYKYTLVGHKGGRDFVRDNFADDKRILDAFDHIPNVGMKSDMLRYLILGKEGGVYTDTDTVALQPVDKWVPAEFEHKVGLVVGIEFDRRDGGPWADISHWVQFCQWTIAAAPGHRVFRSMVERILESLDKLADEHHVPVQDVKPTSFEVMNSTGPAAWTDIVFEELQKHDPSLETTKDLSFMTGPKLFGDVLVLPIDGFGMGQGHSDSTNDGSIPADALVKHLFRGSWRDN